MKIQVKFQPLRNIWDFIIVILMAVIFVEAILLLVVFPSEAATRYVNSDSDGTASAPTRAFDDGSYTPNNSYATATACYNASSAGDTCEFSGGTTGKTYAGMGGKISKAMTWQKSAITGHTGSVTVTYNAGEGRAICVNAAGIVLDGLTISGSDLGTALSTVQSFTGNNLILSHVGTGGNAFRTPDDGSPTVVLNNLTILDNPGVCFTSIYTAVNAVVTINKGWIEGTTGVAACSSNNIYINSTKGITVNYAVIKGGYRTIYAAGGTSTFNNCVIQNYTNSKNIDISAGKTLNLNNCVVLTGPYGISYPATSILNTTNCFIQGLMTGPTAFSTSTGGTWTSTNDILNGFPYFTKTARNIGYISLSTDDGANIAYFKTLADYAMSTYGISMSMFVSVTNGLTSGDKTNLQALYKSGHDIGTHTRHHRDMQYSVNAINVTYSGTGVDDEHFVVSGSGTTLNVTGSQETHLNIDLTSAPYDTLSELCTYIGTWTHYACALVDQYAVDIPSIALKDADTPLPKTVQTSIPYDSATGATNRLFTEEITNSINDLQTAIHLDPTCAAYTTKTMAMPFNSSIIGTDTWIRTNTNLIGTRFSSYPWGANEYYKSADLSNIYLYSISDVWGSASIKGTGYTGLTDAQKQDRVQQTARVMATRASMGFYVGMLSHSATADLTLTEFQWFLDELVKYASAYHIKIASYADIINEIKTSGNWTDATGGYWTRTFTGTDDYHLLAQSPLINAGVDVGLTSDYEGKHVPMASVPDIGAYEYSGSNALFFAM